MMKKKKKIGLEDFSEISSDEEEEDEKETEGGGNKKILRNIFKELQYGETFK